MTPHAPRPRKAHPMTKCKNCGSYAINHHAHGRDGSDGHLCDVCYWRRRAEQPVAREPLTDGQVWDWWRSENGLEDCYMAKFSDFSKVVRAIERAHGIT